MEKFPRIGLGTLNIPNNDAGTENIRLAIEDAGYRYIDTARHYGNHEVIGKALNDLFTRKVVKREELWITTKLPNYKHHPEDVEGECRQALKELQIEYLDLYLVHWPFAHQQNNAANGLHTKGKPGVFPTDENGNIILDRSISFIDTWIAMENLVKLGLVKRIGVCNATIELLERIRYDKRVTIQPYVDQVELHVYMQQNPLIDYCEKRNIQITGFFVLGGDGHIEGPKILEDPVLNEVAKEVNQPPSLVAIKYILSLSQNINVIIKSSSLEHLKSNLNPGFDLTEEQMNKLAGLQRCFRFANQIPVFQKFCPFSDNW